LRAVIIGMPITAPHRRGRREVVIVHHDEQALMTLTVALSSAPYEITASEPLDTLEGARKLIKHEPAAMIVALPGDELVSDIRELLSASDRTAFLFLVPDMPPRAALARLVNQHGSAILSPDEPTVVVIATLFALLAGRGSETNPARWMSAGPRRQCRNARDVSSAAGRCRSEWG
jgi:hypothetical protein